MPSPHHRRSALPIAIALLSAGSGYAQSLNAHDLSTRGMKYFRAEKYELAAQDFEASYALAPLPGLLFNMAQAYRLSGDCVRAGRAYQRYLDQSPQGQLRERASAQLAALKDCGETAAISGTAASSPEASTAAAPELSAEAPPAHPIVAPALSASAPAPIAVSPHDATLDLRQSPNLRQARTRIYKKWWFWTATLGSVALAATAISIGIVATESERSFHVRIP